MFEYKIYSNVSVLHSTMVLIEMSSNVQAFFKGLAVYKNSHMAYAIHCLFSFKVIKTYYKKHVLILSVFNSKTLMFNLLFV